MTIQLIAEHFRCKFIKHDQIKNGIGSEKAEKVRLRKATGKKLISASSIDIGSNEFFNITYESYEIYTNKIDMKSPQTRISKIMMSTIYVFLRQWKDGAFSKL